jgi:hypothetical protein
MYYPNPDPGEPYDDVYAQLFNVNPPPSPIPNRTDVPGMQGFVNNYAANVDAYNADHSFDPIPTDPRIIMNGYTPATLPVLNGLANAYAVCDHWFCSGPSETFCTDTPNITQRLTLASDPSIVRRQRSSQELESEGEEEVAPALPKAVLEPRLDSSRSSAAAGWCAEP